MNNLKYSIIYGTIRPEISERLSLGLIFVEGDKISIRYSEKKLSALQPLLTQSEYEFVGKVIRSLSRNNCINSAETINYLTRYSNNLITVSQLHTIDLEPTKGSQDWLFRNYVYAGEKKTKNKL
ncbi:MAG: hypothetical protein J6K31_09525 [Parabacteroides sp.]|nr:hypothetical protein [Parabacteroides sp.]